MLERLQEVRAVQQELVVARLTVTPRPSRSIPWLWAGPAFTGLHAARHGLPPEFPAQCRPGITRIYPLLRKYYMC